MTNKEAIKELSEWLDGCCGGEEIEPTRQALRLAISALQAQEAKTQLSAEDTTSDLISRQEAIEVADAVWCVTGDVNVAKVWDQLKNLPSAQLEPHWIPVSERLPEEDKDVLVTVYFAGLTQKHKTGWNDHIKPSTYVDIASYYGGDWVSASDEYKVARSRHRVIAWMPLPEPYRAERRTDDQSK